MPDDTEGRQERHQATHSYQRRLPLIISPQLAANFIRPPPVPDASDEFRKTIGATDTNPIQLPLEIIKQHPFERSPSNGRVFLRFLCHCRRQIYHDTHAISSNAAYYSIFPHTDRQHRDIRAERERNKANHPNLPMRQLLPFI